MKNFKILVFSAQYYPDYGPSAPIYTSLCEDLVKAGFDVNVITCMPGYNNKETHLRIPKDEARNGVKIHRVYIFSNPKKSSLTRLFFYLLVNIRFAIRSLSIKKPDVILSDSPGLWTGLPLIIKAIIPRTPFVYVVHDIYPDILQNLNLINNRSLLFLIGKFENYFYSKSSYISVLSNGFKQNLIAKNVPDNKISIIPPCVDTEFIQPMVKNNQILLDLGLSNKFIILYAGNIGISQDFNVIIESAKELKDKEQLVFLIVGDGIMKDKFQEQVKINHLNNIIFSPFFPRDKVPELYSISDLALVTLKKDVVYESVPSKTFSIMASGRPILALVNQDSEVANIISEANCGICIPQGDSHSLSNMIVSLMKDDQKCINMGKNGRMFVMNNYSRNVASRTYTQLIENSKTTII